MMRKIIVDFEGVKARAIDETYQLFGRKHLDILIDLSAAVQLMDEEIEFYSSTYLQQYQDLIDAGEKEAVLEECRTDYKDWIEQVNLVQTNSGGCRYNDIAWAGADKTINYFCFQSFLAYLNLSIIGVINNEQQGKGEVSNKETFDSLFTDDEIKSKVHNLMIELQLMNSKGESLINPRDKSKLLAFAVALEEKKLIPKKSDILYAAIFAAKIGLPCTKLKKDSYVYEDFYRQVLSHLNK